MPDAVFDVAITTYRRPEMVVAAIRSCLSQGHRLNRVIVVDDASGDATESCIRAIGDPRVLLHVRPQNGGMGAARRDAMNGSTADWTIILDSDHELLPGALDTFASWIDALPPNVGIVAARYRWDTGQITPKILPAGVVDYRGRLTWSGVPESIGTDHLTCLSRRVREATRFSCLRSAALVDIAFHLDISRVADAIYMPDCLAFQKSDGPEGDNRGAASHLLARRRKDAEGGLALCIEIMDRHGRALLRWGRPLAGDILKLGAIYAALLDRRRTAVKLALEAVVLGGPRRISPGLVPACAAGSRIFSWAYRERLVRGGATPA